MNPKTKEILLKAEELSKSFTMKNFFGFRSRELVAVRNVSLEIMKGETFGLVGESGCGKSTLGRALIRILEPSSGRIIYKDQDISHLKGAALRGAQRTMQIIFQDPYSSLNPYWDVREILSEPLRKIGLKKEERENRLEELMEKVGLSSRDLSRFPYEFSGGQRQRIGIARAISVHPEFIMCDEPIAALDVSIQAQIVNQLQDLQDEFGLTYLFAAHDLSMVRYVSHRIAVMYLGSFVEQASSTELFRRPLHPYSRALLSAIPLPDPRRLLSSDRMKLQGEIPSPINLPAGCPFAARCPYCQPRCREEVPQLRELEKQHWTACHRAEEL